MFATRKNIPTFTHGKSRVSSERSLPKTYFLGAMGQSEGQECFMPLQLRRIRSPQRGWQISPEVFMVGGGEHGWTSTPRAPVWYLLCRPLAPGFHDRPLALCSQCRALSPPLCSGTLSSIGGRAILCSSTRPALGMWPSSASVPSAASEADPPSAQAPRPTTGAEPPPTSTPPALLLVPGSAFGSRRL
ncbi:hypothetical protein DPEC_G00039010 [Dallia pectoralis]|uniref:Uncharacterized protein n=1 Tax=Dallia pectoralis TaxID=75939 RepID=A0ACC2HEA1_DALPE|nr:hypothetical protein DPEC_G00039010 [Dallia pectoralis]